MEAAKSAAAPAAQPGLSHPDVGLGEPMSQAAAGHRRVEINIVTAEGAHDCSFWIGIFRHGESTPSSLFDFEDVDHVFEHVAVKGLSENEPVMLSDTSTTQARHMLLLPEKEITASQEGPIVQKLLAAVKAWQPSRIGIYVAPEFAGPDRSRLFLLSILSGCILQGGCQQYFLLVGKHGVNTMLNSAFKLKGELAERGVDICIFH